MIDPGARPERVALFATCVGGQFFAEALADGVRLLRHLGFQVEFPLGQTCCGQPHHNAGRAHDARRMAEAVVRALSETEAVVVPSGSCAAMIRHTVPELLAEGPLREAADALASRTWELSEFLVDRAGVTRLGSGLSGLRVAYHHGCHALRGLGVEAQPVVLLREAGAEVVDWVADRECCGFGGAFSVKFSAVSVGMADRKLGTLPPVDVLTSADPACLLHLEGRARARGDGPAIRHLADLLLRAAGQGVGHAAG